MNDSVHVRLLSEISDKALEGLRSVSRGEDEFWEFGGWRESDSPKKQKTDSDSQGLGTKRLIDPGKRSFSKLQQSKYPPKPDRPTPLLLFPLTQSSVLTSPTQVPRTTPRKILSLRTMMTKQVRQVVSMTEKMQPIHSGGKRPSMMEGRLVLPRVMTRQVVRRAGNRQEAVTGRTPVLFL